MKFHLDENVDHAIADGLRRRGIDVSTTTDANLVGESDEVQLAFAVSERRVVVTHDRDFLRLDSAGSGHHGIVYCPTTGQSIGDIIRFLALMHECLKDAGMIGRVEYI